MNGKKSAKKSAKKYPHDDSLTLADIVAALPFEIPETHKLARSLDDLSTEQLAQVATGGIPACFDSARQFDAWTKLAEVSNLDSLHGFCTDCTAEYKARMMMAGRCHFPNVVFVRGHGIRVFVVPLRRSRRQKSIDGNRRAQEQLDGGREPFRVPLEPLVA